MSGRNRVLELAALLGLAVALGAGAGAIAAGFMWLVISGTNLVWTDLPDHFGVDPFNSWWLFAIPALGGVLVGLGQKLLGNYPRPIEDAIATWRSGGQVAPREAPRTAVNSLVALVAGGPVGFEAALTGVLGGTAGWISQRLRLARQLISGMAGSTASPTSSILGRLPSWIAALAGLFTYEWLPFGKVDLTFRFSDFDGTVGVGDGLAAVGFGAIVVVPAAWAISVVGRAERATLFRRSPIVAGVVGGLLFALLAVPNENVLFSGQDSIQLLSGFGTADLLYLAIAKWAALAIALTAGWRGGPIFPTYTSVAALATVAAGAVGVEADIVAVAVIAATSVVFLKGNVPLAIVLTLYPVALPYAAVVALGCAGGAAGLAIARAAGILPVEPAPSESGVVKDM